jgi:hypothetical protein
MRRATLASHQSGALALVAPATVKPGRYTPGDDVLRFLDNLG